MEPEVSLLHSQEPSTCPYPQRDQSSPGPHPVFLKINFNIIHPYTPRFSVWSVSLRFPHENPVCFSPTYVLHALPVLFFVISLYFCTANWKAECSGTNG